MKKIVFTLLAMLLPLAAGAYDFMVGNIAYKIISTTDLTVEVTSGCVPQDGVLCIPSSVVWKDRTFKVIGVGKDACRSLSITELSLADGLTYIGQTAFASNNITVLRIPQTITRIGGSAFYWQNMEPYGLSNYRPKAMEVIIEDGSEQLAGELDSGTQWQPFVSQYNNPQKVYIGRNINERLLSAVMHIYTEELVIGDKVTEITRAQLSSSTSSQMTVLKKLTIGKGLTHVPFINESDKLNDIYLRSETPPTSDGFNSSTYARATLYVPQGTQSVYASADVWKDFWTIEEYTVTDNSQTPFEQVGSTPADGATDVATDIARVKMVFSVNVSTNYSSAVFDYNNICLKADDGTVVSRQLQVNEDEVVLVLQEPLQPNTHYTFTIPANHIKNSTTGKPNPNDFSISFTTGAATGIQNLSIDTPADNRYYTLDGRQIKGVPTQSGVYILNRRKVVIK